MTRGRDDKGSRSTVQTPKQPPRYHSYLLRCWEESGVVTRWRFMLENPHNGEKRGFDSGAALLAFVESELAGGATPAKERGP